MRSDKLYLVDMVEAADHIGRFLLGISFERFEGDELRKSAVLQKLTVIGEAASRVSAELKQKRPEVGWQHIAAFRNMAVHAYFSVDWSIVWETATRNTPELRDRITRVLREEFPD